MKAWQQNDINLNNIFSFGNSLYTDINAGDLDAMLKDIFILSAKGPGCQLFEPNCFSQCMF